VPALLLSGPALLVSAIALVNLLFVLRLRPRPGSPGARVSALVPARDEEGVIEACVRALLAEPVLEVLVYDDGSTDRTAAIVRSIPDPRLRLLPGTPLSPGWAGKPRACAALAAEARGDLLLFVDADVRVAPGSIAALCDAARSSGAALLTAVPRQETGSFAEQLIVPLLHLIYFALAPLWLVARVRDPRVVAANGQLILADARAYRTLGGHGHPSVRAAVVEDQALCRAAKKAGLRVLFADAHLAARCRMYSSARAVRLGFAKNLYLGVGGSPLSLLLALGLVLWTLLLPFLALSLPGVAALLLVRLALCVRFRQPVLGALLHPLAILALCAIALESMVRAHRGSIIWRGRRYGLGGVIE